LSSYAVGLIERFRNKGLLIDTNLLLLYTVGYYDESIIANKSFSRLQAYTVEDYHLLVNVAGLFAKQVTTPHVLTEVSNWLGYLPDFSRHEVFSLFAEMFSPFLELRFEAVTVSVHERFSYLGLTDTAIATIANQYLVLTDDARFVWHLNELALEALNINHLRQEAWLNE
jgi:hypothetical protein